MIASIDRPPQAVSRKAYAIVVLLSVVSLIGIYHQTAWSLVSIWWRSETFAHGFLIVPIVFWLVWMKRENLRVVNFLPEYRALIAVVGFGVLWISGHIVNVLVLQQFAFVAIVISCIWTILGSQASKTIVFPLAFLFLAVPVGEDLVPYLMEFTATFTVEMLRLTGIPVYREGLYFSVPSGDWSVVRACAGIRYLIASITLGILFAYITYSSLSRRVLFVVVSMIVPVVANGMRAYGIVMIGHLSDMKLATGVDHLLYGWVFFGIVMLLLFWIGSIWREPEKSLSKLSHETGPQVLTTEFHWIEAVKPGVAVIVFAILWPLFAYAIENNQVRSIDGVLRAPEGDDGWVQIVRADWTWDPDIHGADAMFKQFYRKEDKVVGAYVGQYYSQQQGDELVSPDYIFSRERKEAWKKVGEGKISIVLNRKVVNLRKAIISDSNGKYLVWYLYRIGPRYTSNQYIAKIIEAFNWLTFSRRDVAILFFVTPINSDQESAASDLQKFFEAMHEGMEASLDKPIRTIEK